MLKMQTPLPFSGNRRGRNVGACPAKRDFRFAPTCVCQKVFMTAVLAPDPGKSIIEDARIQIAVYHLFHVGAEKTIMAGEEIIIALSKSSTH